MKVAILQWVPDHDRGQGTIERISTTASDLTNFFCHQMNSLWLTDFCAYEYGQLGIIDEKYCQFPERKIHDVERLKGWIQSHLESDEISFIYIRGHRSFDDDSHEYHWWKVQIRNLH